MFTMLATAATVCGQQDPVFTPKKSKDFNQSSTDGRCTLRVRVDDEIDVELRGGQVLLRTIAGRPGKDEGSECTQNLPSGGFTKFSFKGIDGRGDVRMVQEPRLGNNWTAVVAIRDKKGGDEGYTFEFSWSYDPRASYPNTSTSGFGTASASNTSSGSSQGTASQGGGILPNLSGSSSSSTRSFGGIDETTRGTGSLRMNNQNFNVQRARVNLRSSGDAEITIYSDEVVAMTGRWTANGNVADVNITNVANNSANASGKVYLTQGGNFERLDVSGNSQRYNDFNVSFRR